MVDKNLFITALIATAVFSVITTLYLKMTKQENIQSRERLARNSIIGSILIFAGLLWCVPVSRPIAPDMLLPYLFPIAIGLGIICAKFIDFHFARAIGGLIILTSSMLLSNVWAFTKTEAQFLPALFAFLTFLFAIIGLFISGKPYLFRDWLRKAAVSSKFKTSVGSFFVAYAVVCAVLAVTLL